MPSSNVLSEPRDSKPAVLPVGRQPISAATSRNYSLAKVVAIFTVATGHWFTGTLLWIPVTFGLFVFAFSSGYFTAAQYGERVERHRFWRRKLERLGLRFWVILAFIALVLLLGGRPIWHWHSLVHVFGLSGVLNWAGVANQSSLGAGLWFFTLLLIFYISYPYLVRLVRSRTSNALVCIASFMLAVGLEEYVKVGHELWLTAFGFIAGVAFGLHRPQPGSRRMLACVLLLWSALLALNLVGIKGFNTVLIAAGAIAVAIWLTVAVLPSWRLLDRIATLEKYLLEIFLIHTYLFIHPTGNSVLDLIVSLALVLLASVALGWIADRLSARIFDGSRS